MNDWLISGFSAFYRWFVSPLLHAWAGPGHGCRFHPTCSEYFFEAVRDQGWIRGSRLGFNRLLSCRPGGSSGWDPVPKQE